LRSRGCTPAAHHLIARISDDIEELEQKTRSRVRKRRARSGTKFFHALDRFVGDLLRAKAETTGPARIYRAVGKDMFKHDPVKYDVFMGVLEGLKALELVEHRKGRTSIAALFRELECLTALLGGFVSRIVIRGNSRVICEGVLCANHLLERGSELPTKSSKARLVACRPPSHCRPCKSRRQTTAT